MNMSINEIADVCGINNSDVVLLPVQVAGGVHQQAHASYCDSWIPAKADFQAC